MADPLEPQIASAETSFEDRFDAAFPQTAEPLPKADREPLQPQSASRSIAPNTTGPQPAQPTQVGAVAPNAPNGTPPTNFNELYTNRGPNPDAPKPPDVPPPAVQTASLNPEAEPPKGLEPNAPRSEYIPVDPKDHKTRFMTLDQAAPPEVFAKYADAKGSVANVKALLHSIAKAEGTLGPDGKIDFKLGVGNHPFKGDFTHHTNPHEFVPQYGLSSSALGGFQFIHGTWQTTAKAENLKDFTPRSQVEATLRQAKDCGAIDLINKGDFNGALRAAGTVWAGVPFSNLKQNTYSYAATRHTYLEHHGTIKGDAPHTRLASNGTSVPHNDSPHRRTSKYEGINHQTPVHATQGHHHGRQLASQAPHELTLGERVSQFFSPQKSAVPQARGHGRPGHSSSLRMQGHATPEAPQHHRDQRHHHGDRGIADNNTVAPATQKLADAAPMRMIQAPKLGLF